MDFKDVKDSTKSFDEKDIENGKGMAILSYIGILALIPYFAEKDNKYVIYHAKQGMNLFLLEIAASVALGLISSILWILFLFIWLLSAVVGIASLVLSILGIVNVLNGKAKELPIINKFQIIK